MFISLNWLKDFVEIPSSITSEELGLQLTTHTVEIDEVEKQMDKFRNIVVGKILEIKKHQNADRLQIAIVDIGKNIEANCNISLNIVCGASNIEVGQLVPVAMIGAILPNGLKIKKTKIREVKSFGMLCSEYELELGGDRSGIMILDKKAKIGQNLGKYLKLNDVIYEVDNKSITNRPDLWGHYGIAREIATFLDVKLKEYNVSVFAEVSKNLLITNIEDYELCPRYMAIVMDGIEIKNSPKWIQRRLSAVGMRPINNIVDITNYVMLELGQPLHVFDASLISDNKIVVRCAKKQEKLKTLDGEERSLDDSMLVIADNKKSIAIAGVIGGANSEINKGTTAIIIESANFNPVSIRKTAQKLGLRTEASKRYEKSLDPNLCEIAIARAIELVQEICEKAKIVSKIVDEKKFKLDQSLIKLDLNWLNNRIGKKINRNRVIKILVSLGFTVKDRKEYLKIKMPTWRATNDVSIKEDLVEEIVRIYGYDNLRPSMPKVDMQSPVVNKERMFQKKVKDILSKGTNLSEVYNYSFVNEGQLDKLKINYLDYIKLANPISNRYTLLRQSLTPNLLENIKFNQARYNEIGIFEIGNVFFNVQGNINKDFSNKDKLPLQEKRIGIIIASDSIDLFKENKGVVKLLFNYFDIKIKFDVLDKKPKWAEDGIATTIISEYKNQKIGIVAQLDKNIAKEIGIKKSLAVIEINFNKFFNLTLDQNKKRYKEIPKYPSAIRDLAFVVDGKICYNNIKQEIESFSKFVNSVELFDVYEGDEIGKNKKNLAFHIEYISLEETLTTEKIENLQCKLSKYLEKKFNVQIRNW